MRRRAGRPDQLRSAPRGRDRDSAGPMRRAHADGRGVVPGPPRCITSASVIIVLTDPPYPSVTRVCPESPGSADLRQHERDLLELLTRQGAERAELGRQAFAGTTVHVGRPHGCLGWLGSAGQQPRNDPCLHVAGARDTEAGTAALQQPGSTVWGDDVLLGPSADDNDPGSPRRPRPRPPKGRRRPTLREQRAVLASSFGLTVRTARPPRCRRPSGRLPRKAEPRASSTQRHVQLGTTRSEQSRPPRQDR